MKQKIKEVSIGEYRARLAEHLDGAAEGKIYRIGELRDTRQILTMSDETLLNLQRDHAKYEYVMRLIDDLGLADNAAIMNGRHTFDLGHDEVLALSHIFLMARQIVIQISLDGPDEVFNNVSVSNIAKTYNIVGQSMMVTTIHYLTNHLFQQNETDMDTLSLGLFLKHMRSGFSQNDILTNTVGDKGTIPTTFNQATHDNAGERHLRILGDALWAIQQLLLQPREARLAGEPYEDHLIKNTHHLIEWRDTYFK